jgi:GT2 family glycosyltransferase
MSQNWGAERRVNPPFIFGNNSVFTRTAIEAVGGYNDALRTNGEDADLSRRLAEANFQTVYQPDAKVRHLRRDTFHSILDTYWRYWKFGSSSNAPVTFVRVLRAIARSIFGRTLVRYLWPDLISARFDLLPIDLMLPWYMTYRYLRFVFFQSGR